MFVGFANGREKREFYLAYEREQTSDPESFVGSEEKTNTNHTHSISFSIFCDSFAFDFQKTLGLTHSNEVDHI